MKDGRRKIKWYKTPEVLTEDALATPAEQEQKDIAEEGEQRRGARDLGHPQAEAEKEVSRPSGRGE